MLKKWQGYCFTCHTNSDVFVPVTISSGVFTSKLSLHTHVIIIMTEGSQQIKHVPPSIANAQAYRKVFITDAAKFVMRI